MTDTSYQFQIPKSRDIGDLISIIGNHVDIGTVTENRLSRTFYDSFDWRLYDAGATLLTISNGDQHHLLLEQPENSTVMNISSPDIPAKIADLSPGPIREKLLPVLDIRALLPQVTVYSLSRQIDVSNKSGKTILRILIEDHSLPGSGTAPPRALGTTLSLQPVKGYHKPFEQIEKLVIKDLNLKPAPASLLQAALAGMGRQPMDYSSKLQIELDPSMRSDAAARIILRHLLGAMIANQAGTRANTDTEFLHDFRVAVRRTRAALSQIKNVFPRNLTRDFKSRFAWLGQLTSNARDLDVYLLKYPDYAASLPEEHRKDLAPLQQFLIQRRQDAQKELVRHLDSNEYKTLIHDWREFLDTPLPDRSDEPGAMRSIRETANRSIRKMLSRVVTEGRAITPESEAEHLHDLRKTCKKLRYLMEFFQCLYPAKAIRAQIRNLKNLQDNLGNFQDCSVQEQKLRLYSQEMLEAGTASAETLLAIGILVQNILAARQHERDAFAENFAHFESEAQLSAFAELFDSP